MTHRDILPGLAFALAFAFCAGMLGPVDADTPQESCHAQAFRDCQDTVAVVDSDTSSTWPQRACRDYARRECIDNCRPLACDFNAVRSRINSDGNCEYSWGCVGADEPQTDAEFLESLNPDRPEQPNCDAECVSGVCCPFPLICIDYKQVGNDCSCTCVL